MNTPIKTRKLINQLTINSYHYLEQLVPTYQLKDLLSVLISLPKYRLIKCISHLLDIVDLSWFTPEYSLYTEMDRSLLGFWTLVYGLSFRKNQEYDHPFLNQISILLAFGDEERWLDDFDEIGNILRDRTHHFFDFLLAIGEESLICHSIDYLGRYQYNNKDWYEDMIHTFLDISSEYDCILEDIFQDLSKSPSFRTWLKKIETSFKYGLDITLRHQCDIEERLAEGQRCVVHLVLENKLPAVLTKYMIGSYI